MKIKSELALYIIVVLTVIIVIVGCVYEEQETKRITERVKEENERTVEIETDKEVDIVLVETHTKEKNKELHLSDYERWVAECIVMGESGGESYDGQVLVAQCLLNACLRDNLQPSEVKVKYKYAGWHENPTNSVKMAVSAVFDEGYKITNEFILYFYAPKLCSSKWHESQCHVITVGGHKFFKEWDD